MNKFAEQHGLEKHRRHSRNGFSSQPNADEPSYMTCRSGDCAQCSSYDLCRTRVLIVGGIERMEKAYRKLVEERGGIFEYHAGHMKSGGKGLENSVQRADLVLCPVNCNSHGACLKVKSLGKKFKKPVHMLSNFSLSAVIRTMEQLHAAN
jgi:hypothetical protein